MAILVDTGPLFALANEADHYLHRVFLDRLGAHAELAFLRSLAAKELLRTACAATCFSLLLFGDAATAAAQIPGDGRSFAVDPSHQASVPASGQTAGNEATAQSSSTNTSEPPSVYDRIWKLTEWYSNSSNPVIQRLRFSGRFQLDYATVDADQGDLSEWNIRRMRLGMRANLFRTLTLHSEVDLNPQEADPLYVRLTDLYVEWSARDRLALTIGKQGISFTADGATSSKELLAIDRSNLAHNIWFTEEYLPGISLSGSAAPWVYNVGLFSAGKENRELGDFTGGVATLASFGYDFARPATTKEALLRFDYVYQNPDPENTFTKPFQHIGSVNLMFETDRWGVRSDLSAALGYYDQSDIWGVMAMPFVNITRKLQLVGRYTFLDSRDANGIELATYEDDIVADRGDRYNEFYVGVNYYFYGHQLKLQSGVQSAHMRDLAADGGDYSGISWTTGLRIGW